MGAVLATLQSSVAVDGECVTLICSREWRMFINVRWGRWWVMKKGMRIWSGYALIHGVGVCMRFNWFTDCLIGSLLTVLLRERLKESLRIVGNYLPNHFSGSSFCLTRGCMQRQTYEGPNVYRHLGVGWGNDWGFGPFSFNFCLKP